MDPEKEVRRELLSLLTGDFYCYEEVSLQARIGLDGRKKSLRCDVLAIPKDNELEGFPIAFECKRPTQDWHYAHWSKAIKQAADYVGSQFYLKDLSQQRTIAGSFVFPALQITPSASNIEECPLVRPGFENAIAGMFHLALQYRCGKAGLCRRNNNEAFSLCIGPNEVWNSRNGFCPDYRRLLGNSRPFGSGRSRI